jgi:acetyl esterase/lipase
MGRSAGGQIAEAVAFQAKDPTLKALIAYHSPADLKFAYDYSNERDIINSRQLLINYLGGDPSQKPAAYQESSPINFVSKDVPPTLLIHGVPDPLTWVEQSRRLNAKMITAGAPVTYLELPWATHAFDYSLMGPGGQISSNATKFFLEKNLKQGSAL